MPTTTPLPAIDVPALLAWFQAHARDLPWRAADADGWAVLVSEVMLQQTPVARVLPVHRDWMTRWPSPADLAAEAPGEAIRHWGRLGYPRRALRLHAAATEIAAHHGNVVPAEVDDLLRLPGIGDYTARAVAAFAYGRRTPVVDTNVLRVLNRVVRGRDSVREAATAADRAELESHLPDDSAVAARFSVALMELGALVCTARNPDCERCPLARDCRWLSAGKPPGRPTRPAQAWHGTDRQLRGRMVAAVRERHTVPEPDLMALGSDAAQATRCLAGLLADGLLSRSPDGSLTFPTA